MGGAVRPWSMVFVKLLAWVVLTWNPASCLRLGNTGRWVPTVICILDMVWNIDFDVWWWTSFPRSYITGWTLIVMQIMQVTKNMMENMPKIPAASLQWLHVSIYRGSWHILGMPGFKLNLTNKNAIMFSNLLWALYKSYKGSQLIHVSPMHTHTLYIEKNTPLPLNPRWPGHVWRSWRRSLHRPGTVWGLRNLCLGMGLYI